MTVANRKRRIRPFRLALLIVFLALVFAIGYFFYSLQATGQGKKATIHIEEGQTISQVLNKLEQKGLIHSAVTANLYAKLTGQGQLYAGDYQLNDKMSVDDLLEYLSKVEHSIQQQKKLTIVPGQWQIETAKKLAKLYPQWDQASILAKWNDESYIKKLAKDYPYLKDISISSIQKLEGYFLPETYFLSPSDSLDKVTRTLLDHFDKQVKANQTKLDKQKLSVKEWVTLASLAQSEARTSKDMKLVVGVLHNRLKEDMPLGLSVTICYGLQDKSDWVACETNTNLDSPYNTYLNKGLPPGPIASPSATALKAVLDYTPSDYLYFLADVKQDGKMYYSKTLEEHEKKIKELGLLIE